MDILCRPSSQCPSFPFLVPCSMQEGGVRDVERRWSNCGLLIRSRHLFHLPTVLVVFSVVLQDEPHSITPSAILRSDSLTYNNHFSYTLSSTYVYNLLVFYGTVCFVGAVTFCMKPSLKLNARVTQPLRPASPPA